MRNNVILPSGGDKYINLNTSLPSSGLHNLTYIMLHQSRVDLTGIPALFSRLGALQEIDIHLKGKGDYLEESITMELLMKVDLQFGQKYNFLTLKKHDSERTGKMSNKIN